MAFTHRTTLLGCLLAALSLCLILGTLAVYLVMVSSNTVYYYGRQMTVDALRTELSLQGKYMNCVTESSDRAFLWNVYIPGIDKTVCFDTVAEADVEIARYQQIRRQHQQPMP